MPPSGTENVPELGTIKLFDRVVPPLSQGKYKLQMTQELPSALGQGAGQLGTTDRNLGTGGRGDRFFEITGPRWHLDPTGVHSMTPPDKEQDAITGAYVPMVVLGRRTLPWERSLFLDNYDDSVLQGQVNSIQLPGVTGDALDLYQEHLMSNLLPERKNDFPSMTVLLFTEDELTFNKGQDDEYVGIFKADKGLKLVDDWGSDHPLSGDDEKGVFHDTPTNYQTAMGLDSPEMAELVVDAVKVRTQKLQQICPTLNEIRLLAHGRQVNPMDKEQCGSDEDGWFAVSVCNRVPSKPFTKYHACLVSLEGRLRDEFIPLVTPTLNSRGDEPTGTVKDIKKIDIKKMYKKSKGKIIGPKKKAKINPKIKKQKKKKKGWFKFSPRKILNMMNFLMADAKSGQSPQNYVAEERDMTIQAADSADAEMARIDDMTIQASERVNAEMVRIDDMTVGLADPIGGTTNLVLLHHWSFKTGAGGDYESRMKSLQLRIVDPGDSDWEVGELVEKIELLDFNYTCTWTDGEVFCRNEHPYNNGTPPPTNCASTVCSNAPMPAPAHAEPMLLGNAMVPDMTANSYLVTDMVHSDGGTTESLYRGPLIAVPENHQPKGIPYGNSDQALEAMTNIDMDNISHASAFEIGRLLALTDESFMKTAARWRRSLYLGGLMGQNYSLLAEKALAFNLDTNMMRFGAPSSMSLQLPSMMSLKAAGQSISKYIPSKNPPIQVKVPTAGPDPIPNETRINMARQQAEQISTNFETGTYGLTGETSGLKGGYGNLNSEYSEQSGGGPD